MPGISLQDFRNAAVIAYGLTVWRIFTSRVCLFTVTQGLFSPIGNLNNLIWHLVMRRKVSLNLDLQRKTCSCQCITWSSQRFFAFKEQYLVELKAICTSSFKFFWLCRRHCLPHFQTKILTKRDV